MPLSQGTILLNRYRVASLIKQSATSALYRAWDTTLNVAVTLKEEPVCGLQAQDEFRQAALRLTKLAHPNLARVTDFFTIPDQGHYLVMEYIQGEDLETLLARGGVLSESQLIPWTLQVLNALDYLHSQKPLLTHGNVRPASIKIDLRGRVVLMDPTCHTAGAQTTPTQNGACFAPPEEFSKHRPGAPGDVYALGATLYVLLTGIDPPSALARQGGGPLPPPRALNGSISARADAIIQKAMQMDPAKRFQHALEMKRALLAPAAPLPAGTGATAANLPWMPPHDPTPPTPDEPGSPQPDAAPPALVSDPAARRRGWAIPRIWLAVLILGLAIAVTGGFFLFRQPPAMPALSPTATLLVAAAPQTASATPTRRVFTTTSQPSRTPTATTGLTQTPTRQPTWYPCPDSPPSGLKIGMRAQVSLDPGLPNNVRASAGKSYPLLGKIQPGEIVMITNGPDCADGGVWWRIRSETSGLEGWTAEGDAEDAWLLPLP